MPLPATVPTGTVEGLWLNPDGTTATGFVIFRNRTAVKDELSDPAALVVNKTVIVQLVDGTFSVELAIGEYDSTVRINSAGVYRASYVFTLEEDDVLDLSITDPNSPTDDLTWWQLYWATFPFGQYDWPFNPRF